MPVLILFHLWSFGEQDRSSCTLVTVLCSTHPPGPMEMVSIRIDILPFAKRSIGSQPIYILGVSSTFQPPPSRSQGQQDSTNI